MKPWVPGLCCLLLAGAALAGGHDSASKHVQASMLVTGTIEVAPNGNVLQYTLDQPEKVPSGVTRLLAKTVPAWKFAPVVRDGKPVIARAPMGLRITAKPLGEGSYSVSVESSWFGYFHDDEKHRASAEDFTYEHQERAAYPYGAAQAMVSGTVYVLVLVGRDGKVVDAMARQVNLRALASDSEMAVWRMRLGQAAVRALQKDTFHVPTVGPDSGRPYWLVNIPVDFVLDGPGVPAAAGDEVYGQWQPYVPGPLQEPAWAEKQTAEKGVDAVPEGGSLLANTSLHLLTPLGGS